MQASSNELSPYFPYFFPIFFLALWAISDLTMSFLSGWHLLSKRFRAPSEPYGDTRSAGPFFCQVRMRFRTMYNGGIRITTAEDALYLSVIFTLRVGHPPLRIPWNEIEMSKTKYLWFRYVILTLGKQEAIPMRISERLACKLGILDRKSVETVKTV